jgi:hypothetical protein
MNLARYPLLFVLAVLFHVSADPMTAYLSVHYAENWNISLSFICLDCDLQYHWCLLIFLPQLKLLLSCYIDSEF